MNELTDDCLLRRLKHLPQTIECGIHSGIPPCCVQHYVTVHMWRNEDERHAYQELVDASGHDVRYTPCPRCLDARSFVETRSCPDGRCWHREELAGEEPERGREARESSMSGPVRLGLKQGRAEVVRWLREMGHGGDYYADTYTGQHRDQLPVCSHEWTPSAESWNAEYEYCARCLVYRTTVDAASLRAGR